MKIAIDSRGRGEYRGYRKYKKYVFKIKLMDENEMIDGEFLSTDIFAAMKVLDKIIEDKAKGRRYVLISFKEVG